MVIEFLTFRVSPAGRDEWMAHEEQHWSRFLERQAGFVRKQMWVPAEEPGIVHAVIWWESMAHWKSIAQEDLDAVAERMGVHEIVPRCDVFEVVRAS